MKYGHKRDCLIDTKDRFNHSKKKNSNFLKCATWKFDRKSGIFRYRVVWDGAEFHDFKGNSALSCT